jgi:hypothetical protein
MKKRMVSERTDPTLRRANTQLRERSYTRIPQADLTAFLVYDSSSAFSSLKSQSCIALPPRTLIIPALDGYLAENAFWRSLDLGYVHARRLIFTNALLAPTASDELAAKVTKKVGGRRQGMFIASQATQAG